MTQIYTKIGQQLMDTYQHIDTTKQDTSLHRIAESLTGDYQYNNKKAWKWTDRINAFKDAVQQYKASNAADHDTANRLITSLLTNLKNNRYLQRRSDYQRIIDTLQTAKQDFSPLEKTTTSEYATIDTSVPLTPTAQTTRDVSIENTLGTPNIVLTTAPVPGNTSIDSTCLPENTKKHQQYSESMQPAHKEVAEEGYKPKESGNNVNHSEKPSYTPPYKIHKPKRGIKKILGVAASIALLGSLSFVTSCSKTPEPPVQSENTQRIEVAQHIDTPPVIDYDSAFNYLTQEMERRAQNAVETMQYNPIVVTGERVGRDIPQYTTRNAGIPQRTLPTQVMTPTVDGIYLMQPTGNAISDIIGFNTMVSEQNALRAQYDHRGHRMGEVHGLPGPLDSNFITQQEQELLTQAINNTNPDISQEQREELEIKLRTGFQANTTASLHNVLATTEPSTLHIMSPDDWKNTRTTRANTQ